MRYYAAILVVLSAAASPSLRAGLIDFEGFADSTILTTQYLGITFDNTIILTAGVSLNEFEFPPHSGVNVASDSTGPITITFSSPVTSFEAYFTYLTQVTLTAFDPGNSQVAQVLSQFNSNLALSGDAGSNPNEFLRVAFPSGISTVMIAGDPAGSSFALDDVTYWMTGAPVPEPASVSFLLLATLAFFVNRHKTRL